MFHGTTVEGTVQRVVDGDTIRVTAGSRDESLRILALDTEEVHPGAKPVTPWGREASEEAKRFFSPGDAVTLEFPGAEPSEVAWEKYRGNFGRPLVFVHKDGQDFQEHMIRKGFSPYFVKYGYAQFEEYHERYRRAEREAQRKHIGVWDQITVNGTRMRNYAALGVWWALRAEIIEAYRRERGSSPNLLNTRLDYASLEELADQERGAIVFTELRELRRLGGDHAVIRIGSEQQPFQLFLPNVVSDEGIAILNLLQTRYFTEDLEWPGRSYAYVQGPLQKFQGRPDLPPIVEMMVTSADQITDGPPES